MKIPVRLEHVKNNYHKYDYMFITYKTHILTELCRALYFNNLLEQNAFRIHYNKKRLYTYNYTIIN